MLLVHYLDDFSLVYTDKGILREAGGVVVRALVEGSFLISPESALDPLHLVPEPGDADNCLPYLSPCPLVL